MEQGRGPLSAHDLRGGQAEEEKVAELGVSTYSSPRRVVDVTVLGLVGGTPGGEAT